MTTEQTLKLLKPIMLDGSEKEGDKVYSTLKGDCVIDRITSGSYPIHASGNSFTDTGMYHEGSLLPSLFKCNPYEWLAMQNQGRVIQVKFNETWEHRVLQSVKNGYAICWVGAETIEQAKLQTETSKWKEWRELSTTITKAEALKMLAEKGVDTTNLIIE